MPIEFRCSQCGKLLRTGDDTAGRQAQCPECGTISIVPNPAVPSEPSVPPLTPLGGGNPFAAGQGTATNRVPTTRISRPHRQTTPCPARSIFWRRNACRGRRPP